MLSKVTGTTAEVGITTLRTRVTMVTRTSKWAASTNLLLLVKVTDVLLLSFYCYSFYGHSFSSCTLISEEYGYSLLISPPQSRTTTTSSKEEDRGGVSVTRDTMGTVVEVMGLVGGGDSEVEIGAASEVTFLSLSPFSGHS